jgi:hypothetical protein
MFRRLVLAAVTLLAAPLVPALSGHAHAASSSLCASATSNPQITVLRFEPTSTSSAQTVGGIFCFTVQYTVTTGYSLQYEAQISGLDPRLQASMRVDATLTDTRALSTYSYMYQPVSVVMARTGCGGCMHPALHLPSPPHTLFATQSTTHTPDSLGYVDAQGAVGFA